MDNILPGVQRKKVKILDKEIVGRPIKWDKKPVTRDLRAADGEYIIPTEYESQCPFCCLRITFGSNLKSIRCQHCNRGDDQIEFNDFPDPFFDPDAISSIGLPEQDREAKVRSLKPDRDEVPDDVPSDIKGEELDEIIKNMKDDEFIDDILTKGDEEE